MELKANMGNSSTLASDDLIQYLKTGKDVKD